MIEAELVAIEARVRLVLTCHECKTLLLQADEDRVLLLDEVLRLRAVLTSFVDHCDCWPANPRVDETGSHAKPWASGIAQAALAGTAQE